MSNANAGTPGYDLSGSPVESCEKKEVKALEQRIVELEVKLETHEKWLRDHDFQLGVYAGQLATMGR